MERKRSQRWRRMKIMDKKMNIMINMITEWRIGMIIMSLKLDNNKAGTSVSFE